MVVFIGSVNHETLILNILYNYQLSNILYKLEIQIYKMWIKTVSCTLNLDSLSVWWDDDKKSE